MRILSPDTITMSQGIDDIDNEDVGTFMATSYRFMIFRMVPSCSRTISTGPI